MNENIQKEREIRIEYQLNWNLYKENLIKKDSDKIDSGLMTNINTSFTQGAGLGNLIQIAKMIQKSSRLENDGYFIRKDLYEMLLENINFSNKLIQVVGDIDHVIKTDLPKKNISINELHVIIKEAEQEVSKYQSIRGNSIVVAENPHISNTKTLSINTDYFKKAVIELLFNAFKFSDEGSKIYILFEMQKDSFQISFLNTPDSKSKEHNGIGQAYQNIIFEPFFRISRFVFEAYPTLDFGLGLCYVEKIIQNHKGKIRVVNLKNYIEKTNQVLIGFCIEIPFVM
jgi:K+-sensing histidine kinase KdpD